MDSIRKTEIGYIYSLASSNNPDDVRYIGYSVKPLVRLNNHLSGSKYCRTHKEKWIHKQLSDSNTIIINILRVSPIDKIQEAETQTILLFKSLGAKLVNGNNGGKGGISPSSEVRKKISISKLGNTWNIGRMPSESNIIAVREASKRPRTELAKYNMSVAHKGQISPYRKFCDEDIIKMYSLYNMGYSGAEISRFYKCRRQTICSILFNKSYTDIIEKYNLKLTITKGKFSKTKSSLPGIK